MINFETTPEDRALIDRIVDRAKVDDPMGLDMDITACHCNGNPLDLQKFADALYPDFWHDINGIRLYIDRSTGKLSNCFVPRCSA